MKRIHCTLEHLEKNVLNPMYAPVASSVAGVARAVLGVAQVGIGGLAYLLGPRFDNSDEVTYYGKHHFVHGIMNLSRAIIEMIPFVNLLTLAYDADAQWGQVNNPGRFQYISYPQLQQS